MTPTTRTILAIESTCDETGAAVLRVTWSPELPPSEEGSADRPRVEVLSDVVASSMDQHARFGGVVPEIASRAHLEALQPVVREALAAVGEGFVPDCVAAAVGPGLAGALLVGSAGAKAYAAAWGVPFYGVNHLGGHVAIGALGGADLTNAVALLVSGGHTQLLHVRGGAGRPMTELGSTLDDAAGEAYDKVSRLLGLGYPGGPVIDRLARGGDPAAVKFPRGMMRPQDSRHDFSFSGLKTAVARYVEAAERDGRVIDMADTCASFQEAVCDVLTFKAVRAATDVGATTLLLGGGVAANSRLRELAAERCAAAGIDLHVPPPRLCTDNGVMIGAIAAHVIAAGAEPSGYGCATDPSLPVEEPVVAAG